MTPRFYISASLVFIVFLAGCLGGGGTKTDIISTDMLTVKSIDVFPSTQVQPGDRIVIRMEVENVGQDATYLLVDKDSNKPKNEKKVSDPNWNGDYLLIDHCSTLYNSNTKEIQKDADFQILSGGSCAKIYGASDSDHNDPLIPLVKDSDGKPIALINEGGKDTEKACYLKLPPHQSHTFQWTLRAPTEEAISKMTQKCDFKFQTAYAARAVTNTYVYFADPLEVAERIYTKKEMSLVGDNIASYGPVAVNFMPAEPQPVPARKDETWTVFLNIINAGNGIANVDDMGIQIPNDAMAVTSCLALGGIDEKLKLIDILTQNNPELRSGTKLIDFIAGNGVQLQGGTTIYAYNICASDNLKNKDSCSSNIALIKKYDDLCKSGTDRAFCEANLKDINEIKKSLEETKALLKIYGGKSSRIPCELTVPSGITILSPFKFVTTADYTYKIRDDITITTKPFKTLG